MDHLDQLEQQSVYIFREAFRHFERLCMLWSIGKDSTVMLWLARKAFFGHVPFPLVHIDTSYKLPEMIAYRDKLAIEYKLQMVVGQNKAGARRGRHVPRQVRKQPEHDAGGAGRGAHGVLRPAQERRARRDAARHRAAHAPQPRRPASTRSTPTSEPYTGVIVGARADEEGSRSKERYFSPRDKHDDWDVGDQPPEFWNQFKTDFAPGTHVRIHPLLDWTELNIWEYIKRENIPTVSLYYDQGDGTRYRSLGCGPCQAPIQSTAKNVDDIIAELKSGKLRNIAERSGRLQDGKHGLEELRRKGYM